MKHVLRRLLQSPGFTAVTLLTLALGIGATTAIFTVIDAVLLKPLPYPRPAELVSVAHGAPGIKIKQLPMSPSCYFTYRKEGKAFQDIALWTPATASVTGLAEPEQVRALAVTDGIFRVLRVQPALGRSFTRADDAPGAADTVMLSYGYWQRKFGGDGSVVGRSLTVDAKPHTIIGVLPPRFRLADTDAAIVFPLQFDPGKTKLGNYSYRGVARLQPGVSVAQADADVARMIRIVYARFAPPAGASLKLFESARLMPDIRPLKAEVVGDIGKILWVLMGTVGIVLLIACANVANLLLVRAEGRQHELAIRAALGAGWGRIARDLLLESATLAALGGALGIVLADAAIRALIAIAPTGLPRLNEISLDASVLLFAVAISMGSGIAFGLAPVVKYAGAQIGSAVREGGRSVSQCARGALVVTQVALALVLLIGAGLMVRTFQSMTRVRPGFTHPETLQTLTISIPEAQVADADQVVRIEAAILEKIAQIPGVESAAFASGVPMDGNNSWDPVWAESVPQAENRMPAVRRYKFTSPGLLRTIGNPLIAGRDYTWTDIYEKRPVAIVTENLAREYWGGAAQAIGKRIREMPTGGWREVIGVAGDEREDGVDRPAPTIVYWPALAANFQGRAVIARRTVVYAVRSSRAGSQPFAEEIRRAVWSVNADLPLAGVRTLQETYTKSMARTSFALVMLGLSAAMALALGIVGIYGVISYSVSQRKREIGIRMALGAQQPAVASMFVRQGLRLAGIGLVFGLVAACLLTRWMTSLLFGVSAADPATYAAVSIALALTAAIASYLPSRRASAVDPMEALRVE